jgi:biotin operon repressor
MTAALLPASRFESMIAAMTNPKLDKALRLLVAIERRPQSSHELATTLGVSRPTSVRLVEELRGLGCRIESVRDGMDWRYHLHDWGVFSPARVRKYLKDAHG